MVAALDVALRRRASAFYAYFALRRYMLTLFATLLRFTMRATAVTRYVASAASVATPMSAMAGYVYAAPACLRVL